MSGRRRAAAGLAILARLTFAVLIVCLPFRARADVLPHPANSLPAVLTDLVIYAVDVLAVATLALWLLSRALDRRPITLPPLALRLPIALLVALAWVTMPLGIEPLVSVAGATRITLGALLAVFVLNEVDGLRSVAVPLGAMLGLQALVAIGQVTGGGSVGLPALGELDLDPLVHGTSVVTVDGGTRLLRAYGLSPHPNVLGGVLACGSLLFLGAPARGRLTRAAQVSLVVLAGLALVVTFSRGAWLGALAGGLAGLALLVLARRPVDARRWVATGVLALAVAGGAAWLARDAVAARTRLAPDVAATEGRSVEERLAQIRLGWRVVVEHPFSGVGASAVPLAMRDLEPDFAFGLYPPHLVGLAVAGELGIGGAIAYVWLLVAPWVLLARSRRRWTVELAAATAALTALTVVSLFDIYPWAGGPGRTLGWLVIGLWAMAYARAERTLAAASLPAARARATALAVADSVAADSTAGSAAGSGAGSGAGSTAGSTAGSSGRPQRVPRAVADGLIRELGAWLEGDAPSGVAATTGAWDGETRAASRRLIAAHGLAAFLVRDPIAARVTATQPTQPTELHHWLTAQEVANRARIQRLQAELASVLRAFDASGIPVMPLKGSVLWERPGGDPFRRPMADLDLLVRPPDREAARAALTALGYSRVPGRHRQPTHDTFQMPGNERVVSMAGEHPDNPRRIELHVEVKRHLWGWVDDDDLTDFLWAGARFSTVVGEPAILPTDLALLAHLAIHATSDLLLGRGRLIQLVDVADLAASVAGAGAGPLTPGPGVLDVPHSRLVQPAIALAARRLSGRGGVAPPEVLAGLAARVPARLARWTAEVPLDTRAGLQAGRILPDDVNTLEARWGRWAPYRWRLLVAFGDMPLPVAAARHALRLLRIASRRLT